MNNLSNFIKRLRDIMRNDAGINGDAQRIEQIAWMLFLKVYDAKEEDWELEAIADFAKAALVNDDQMSVVDLQLKKPEEIVKYLMDFVHKNYEQKKQQLGDPSQMLEFEKVVIL